MKKTKIIGKLPKQRNPIAQMLCTQGQFKNKVFENKKKKIKKFDWRKEISNNKWGSKWNPFLLEPIFRLILI